MCMEIGFFFLNFLLLAWLMGFLVECKAWLFCLSLKIGVLQYGRLCCDWMEMGFLVIVVCMGLLAFWKCWYQIYDFLFFFLTLISLPKIIHFSFLSFFHWNRTMILSLIIISQFEVCHNGSVFFSFPMLLQWFELWNALKMFEKIYVRNLKWC